MTALWVAVALLAVLLLVLAVNQARLSRRLGEASARAIRAHWRAYDAEHKADKALGIPRRRSRYATKGMEL